MDITNAAAMRQDCGPTLAWIERMSDRLAGRIDSLLRAQTTARQPAYARLVGQQGVQPQAVPDDGLAWRTALALEGLQTEGGEPELEGPEYNQWMESQRAAEELEQLALEMARQAFNEYQVAIGDLKGASRLDELQAQQMAVHIKKAVAAEIRCQEVELSRAESRLAETRRMEDNEKVDLGLTIARDMEKKALDGYYRQARIVRHFDKLAQETSSEAAGAIMRVADAFSSAMESSAGARAKLLAATPENQGLVAQFMETLHRDQRLGPLVRNGAAWRIVKAARRKLLRLHDGHQLVAPPVVEVAATAAGPAEPDDDLGPPEGDNDGGAQPARDSPPTSVLMSYMSTGVKYKEGCHAGKDTTPMAFKPTVWVRRKHILLIEGMLETGITRMAAPLQHQRGTKFDRVQRVDARAALERILDDEGVCLNADREDDILRQPEKNAAFWRKHPESVDALAAGKVPDIEASLLRMVGRKEMASGNKSMGEGAAILHGLRVTATHHTCAVMRAMTNPSRDQMALQAEGATGETANPGDTMLRSDPFGIGDVPEHIREKEDDDSRTASTKAQARMARAMGNEIARRSFTSMLIQLVSPTLEAEVRAAHLRADKEQKPFTYQEAWDIVEERACRCVAPELLQARYQKCERQQSWKLGDFAEKLRSAAERMTKEAGVEMTAAQLIRPLVDQMHDRERAILAENGISAQDMTEGGEEFNLLKIAEWSRDEDCNYTASMREFYRVQEEKKGRLYSSDAKGRKILEARRGVYEALLQAENGGKAPGWVPQQLRHDPRTTTGKGLRRRGRERGYPRGAARASAQVTGIHKRRPWNKGGRVCKYQENCRERYSAKGCPYIHLDAKRAAAATSGITRAVNHRTTRAPTHRRFGGMARNRTMSRGERGPPLKRSDGAPQAPGKCYACGGAGHQRKNCPNRKAARPRPRAGRRDRGATHQRRSGPASGANRQPIVYPLKNGARGGGSMTKQAMVVAQRRRPR